MRGRDAVVAAIRSADPEDDLVVTLRRGDLRALVRAELAAALSERPKVQSPRVAISGAELAEVFSVSRVTVHRWRKRGMPAIAVGDEFRYIVVDCLNFLKGGGDKGAPRGGDA